MLICNGGVVQEPVQDGGGHDLIGEDRSPVENPRLEASTMEPRS
jgi:hypothetical protein